MTSFISRIFGRVVEPASPVVKTRREVSRAPKETFSEAHERQRRREESTRDGSASASDSAHAALMQTVISSSQVYCDPSPSSVDTSSSCDSSSSCSSGCD